MDGRLYGPVGPTGNLGDKGEQGTGLPTGIDYPMVKSYHLKFRGITFLVILPSDAGEYFSDLKNITKGELRVFEVVYPDHHVKIKEAWSEAYLKVQAAIVFDKED